jgi:hypothetical protein
MYKIALIVPYFGKLPPFFKVWEATALENDTVDFFVLTDDRTVACRRNIHVISMTFGEFTQKVQEKFDFPVSLERPYKICDYKPAFGYIFQDLLQDYDWWGYCDVDLLLGNIRKFFTDDVLRKYDRCQTLGHLSIYRNCDQMNRLFQTREDSYPGLNYDAVYSSEESMYFDETRGAYTKCLINGIHLFQESAFRDPLTDRRKFYHSVEKPETQYVVFWENGRLDCVYRDGRRTELLYAHFFRRKFLVEAPAGNLNSIKIIPGKAIVNAKVNQEDFAVGETVFYRLKYHIKTIYNSLRRYGFRKTVYRQRWSRDHDRYVEELQRKHSR